MKVSVFIPPTTCANRRLGSSAVDEVYAELGLASARVVKHYTQLGHTASGSKSGYRSVKAVGDGFLFAPPDALRNIRRNGIGLREDVVEHYAQLAILT